MEHRNKPRLLDLFTGTGSVARVAEELGYEVHTLDIDRRCKPDLCVDVLEFDYANAFEPGYFDVVWASPPCHTFSCARKCNIGRYVKGEMCTRETLTRDAQRAAALCEGCGSPPPFHSGQSAAQATEVKNKRVKGEYTQ